MKYSVDKNKACWKILDGEAVIINTDTTFYYSLNKTGTFIWELLAKKEMGLEELVKSVSAHYRKKEEEIYTDVKTVLEDLAKERLLKTK